MTEKKNITISNKNKLEKIKYKIHRAGPNKLHVLTDFDRTLTKNFVDGKEIPSVISILRDGSYLTKDYAARAHALFNKYHPTEIDPKIPLEEKKKAMHEWWSSHYKLLIETGLNKKDIEQVVNSEKIKLREGVLEFLDLLHNYDIPLVIISSGGLGIDSILGFFEKEGKAYENIYIISNSFEWDKNGNAIRIKEPIIHSMNKDETSVKDFPAVYEAIKNRKNVLLLGDTLGDVGMIKGFDYDNILKVGFLNKNVEEILEPFKKAYDIIILNDSDMFCVNDLLKELVKTV